MFWGHKETSRKENEKQKKAIKRCITYEKKVVKEGPKSYKNKVKKAIKNKFRKLQKTQQKKATISQWKEAEKKGDKKLKNDGKKKGVTIKRLEEEVWNKWYKKVKRRQTTKKRKKKAEIDWSQ